MYKKQIKLTVLIIFIISLLTVPLTMIKQQEKVLTQGVEYKFKTAPIDPYDYFRGRYVALGIDQSTAPLLDKRVTSLSKAYAVADVDV